MPPQTHQGRTATTGTRPHQVKQSKKKTMRNDEDDDQGGGGITCGAVTVELDLQDLPEGCIANVISLTTPPDACRLSSVSRSFRSAAESDAVWSKFLPPDIPTNLSHSGPDAPNCRSKSKELYLALCHDPVLIDEGKMSFSLDKWSGKKCYMVAARALEIVWADTPNYWKWISMPDSRFEEVAELVGVCWLDIRGKIDIRLLSPSTMYKAYVVFKSTAAAYGFEYQPAEVSVGLVGGAEPTKQTVFLDADRGRTQSYQIVPRRVGISNRSRILPRVSQPREINDNQYPKDRADGWLEIELGEFFCEGGEDGELEMTCLETKGGQWKGGLIVQGIEVRPQRKS
ncbi:PREDICTED: putative F-box protein PP2-B12 isoform X2 [Fragaria vesca subsp. vesca]|uniref:putative F-box protein PP2-B12 isoform X2 n=1 Tax=Fragaria vesca subsp. vesca TaxID=101020 RepID=UPI0002C35DB7|nr:PREDICTED: putative F-box protein PP2-B12 isoform X2 [Fragaria vesca subsp. vesca]